MASYGNLTPAVDIRSIHGTSTDPKNGLFNEGTPLLRSVNYMWRGISSLAKPDPTTQHESLV